MYIYIYIFVCVCVCVCVLRIVSRLTISLGSAFMEKSLVYRLLLRVDNSSKMEILFNRDARYIFILIYNYIYIVNQIQRSLFQIISIFSKDQINSKNHKLVMIKQVRSIFTSAWKIQQMNEKKLTN